MYMNFFYAFIVLCCFPSPPICPSQLFRYYIHTHKAKACAASLHLPYAHHTCSDVIYTLTKPKPFAWSHALTPACAC